MNADTINLVAIIVIGLLAVAVIVVHAYSIRKGDEKLETVLAPYQAIAESLVARLDKVLEPYGETTLKPLYDLSVAAGTLIDEPDDFVSKLLPDDIEDVAREVLRYIKSLSDGVPPQEVNIAEGVPPVEMPLVMRGATFGGASPTYTAPMGTPPPEVS